MIQPAGRLVEHQKLFAADHGGRSRKSLLLPAGQRVRVTLTDRCKPQILKRFRRKLRVRALDAERAFGLHALGEKLIVRVLHGHT